MWGWCSDKEGTIGDSFFTLMLHGDVSLDIKEALNQVFPGFLAVRYFEKMDGGEAEFFQVALISFALGFVIVFA